MSTRSSQQHGGSIALKLGSFVLLSILIGFASVASATYTLPASRMVQWQGNVGVAGDIPARSTVYTTVTPSGGNDATAIQSAINNCPAGQVVNLAAGTFSISSPITVKSGVTLRGAGMGSTTIKGAAGMSGSYLVGFSAGNGTATSVNITGGMSKGSNTITTASAHGLSVGDVILIDQLNSSNTDPVVTNVGTAGTCSWCGRASGTRSLGQLAKVVAVPTSTTATLEIPLYWNYASNLTPQASKLTGLTSNAGIEDLTVDNSASASSKQSSDGATIALYGSQNCWLLRVEGIGSYTNMIRIKNSYRDTIRGCKIHEGTPALPVTGSQYYTSRAYGIVMDYASANLIENNQIYHLTMGVAMRGPTSGNVCGYNYINDMYYSESMTWQTDSFDFHGGHAMMNLFESNYVAKGRVCADYVWGSSSNNTFFRNRQAIDTARPAAAWDYSLYKYSTYYNFIGNIIGTPGFETTYLLQTGDTSVKAIYGFSSLPVATSLLHGNWDTVTNSVTWNGNDDRTLPASLYLAGKPSWWGNTAWPAIGPDVSPKYPAAPAVGTGTPWGIAKPALSAPSLTVH